MSAPMNLALRLFDYAKRGNIDKLRSCVCSNNYKKEWTMWAAKKSGDTVLTYATRHGHLPILEWLHKSQGADLEVPNLDGKRPLHEAAQYGNIQCLQYLIDNKVNINCLKRADWTPLMLACTKSDIQVVHALLKAGADPHLKNKDGWNSFHIACREGHTDILKLLPEYNKDLWNTISKNGRSPLHTAALHGKLDAVKLLLQCCDYPVDQKDSCGSTPMMDALRAGHVELADCLCQKQKADVRVEDNMGRQSLHLAAQAGCESSVLFLLSQHHVNVNTQSTGSAVTALHVASKEGQYKMLELLITHRADVHQTDSKGRTALHIASGSQHTECVRVLLEHAADNVPDTSGTTPSMMAIKTDIKQLFNQYNSSVT